MKLLSLLLLTVLLPSHEAMAAHDEAGVAAGLKISREINDAFDVMEVAETADQFDSSFHAIGSVMVRPNLSKTEKAFLCSSLISRLNSDLVQIETQILRSSAKENLAKCYSELSRRLEQEHIKINVAANVTNTFIPKVNFRKQKFPDAPAVYKDQNINAKEVILTFDDGPNPRTTPIILDILDRAGVKAVFFNVGENSMDHPALTRQLVARGHGLGSHSFFHTMRMGCKMQTGVVSQNYVLSDMIKGHAAILSASGTIDPFVRFPNGDRTKVLMRNMNEMGLSDFFWAVDTEDWKNAKDRDGVPRAQAILNQFVHDLSLTKRNANSDRGIVLMHDIWGQTAEALPLILNWLKTNNYTVVLPSSGLRTDIKLNENVPNYYEPVVRSIHSDKRKAVNVFSFNPELTKETRARPIDQLASTAETEWNEPGSLCTMPPRANTGGGTAPPPVAPVIVAPDPLEAEQTQPAPQAPKKKKKKSLLKFFGGMF